MSTCLTLVLMLFCGVFSVNLITYGSAVLTQSYNVNLITKKGLVVPCRLSQLQELRVLETCRSKDLGKTLLL